MDLIELLNNLLDLYGNILTKEDIEAIKYIKSKNGIEVWSKNNVQNFIKKTLLAILSEKYVTPSELEFPLHYITNEKEHMTYIQAINVIHAYAEIGTYISQNCFQNLLVAVFNKAIWLSKINYEQRNIILGLIMYESNSKQIKILEDFISKIEEDTTQKYLQYLHKNTATKFKYSIAKKDIHGIIESLLDYYNYKLSMLSGNTENFKRTKNIIMDYFDTNFQSDIKLQFDYFYCEREYKEFQQDYEKEKKLLFEYNE